MISPFKTWQIMEGLKFLHTLDPAIAHRNIKGVNILVNDDLICCLSDFLYSSIFDTSERSRGKVVSTPPWMAPEVSYPPSDGRIHLLAADIFSLGVTLLEVC
jgi:serine/threonine protein kinase